MNTAGHQQTTDTTVDVLLYSEGIRNWLDAGIGGAERSGADCTYNPKLCRSAPPISTPLITATRIQADAADRLNYTYVRH